MSTLATLVRRYPLTAFGVLACVFGWSVYAFAAVGIGSNPENLPLGPVFAALVVTSIQGRVELRAWGRRIRHWAASPWLYALAVGSPILMLASNVLCNHAFGASLPTAAQLGDWPQVPAAFLVMIVMVGLGEEAGWTAFAAPVLLRRHGVLGAWARLAPLRIFWHLPLLVTGNMPFSVWLLGNAGFQLIVLQMMRASNGAWSLAAVWHATLNAFGGAFLFRMVTGADLDRLSLLLGVSYGLVGAATLVPMYLSGRMRELTEPLELAPLPAAAGPGDAVRSSARVG